MTGACGHYPTRVESGVSGPAGVQPSAVSSYVWAEMRGGGMVIDLEFQKGDYLDMHLNLLQLQRAQQHLH